MNFLSNYVLVADNNSMNFHMVLHNLAKKTQANKRLMQKKNSKHGLKIFQMPKVNTR
jgi:hypothetical protein